MEIIGRLTKALNGIFVATCLSNTAFLTHADEVDELIAQIMTERHIPGLQLAVVNQGKIVKLGHYGHSNLQDYVAVTDDTLFPINSMTKAFAGVALMQLVEQGKLSIDDEIGQHLSGLPKSWQSLKIKHLMAHTSGLPKILSGYWTDLIVRGNPEKSWQKVLELPLQFEENTQFSYNQTGYVIIGKILDKFLSQGFPTFITQQQFDKVGMPRTKKAGFTNLELVISNQARQYLYLPSGQFRNVYIEFPYIMRTAAGMSSTASELASYIIALSSGELLKDTENLWQPVVLKDGTTRSFGNIESGYAMGWQVIDRDKHKAVSSSGADANTLIYYPEDNLSVIVLTNKLGALPIQFVDQIAAHFIENFSL